MGVTPPSGDFFKAWAVRIWERHAGLFKRDGGNLGEGVFKLEECLVYLTKHNVKLLAEELDRRLEVRDLTHVQAAALYFVYTYPGLTQKELARKLGRAEPTVARLVDRLQTSGFLVRRHLDRRTYRIELTEEGYRKITGVSGIMQGFMDDCVRGISQEDLDTFNSVIQRMQENIVGTAEK
jgi:MarR family transcriptional regulator for hemolysin